MPLCINIRDEVDMSFKTANFRCPGCKGIGEIDAEQEAGTVSIVCDCGFHGYAKDGEIIHFREVMPDPNFNLDTR